MTSQAHKRGMRVATVNPANTSRFAFDGSGAVRRGFEMVDDPSLRKKLDEKSLSNKEYAMVKKLYQIVLESTPIFKNGVLSGR